MAISAITLLEIALLASEGKLKIQLREFLQDLQSDTVFQVLPLTSEIACEVASIGAALRDPADRTIIATALIHGLTLVTSDQRIIDSGLVAVVE